jgi:hypothetical protein
MVTNATAETSTKEVKKRGRPKKYGVALKIPQVAPGAAAVKGTTFQKLIKAYSSDTLVKGFAGLRRKLFNSGEPVDQITQSLKRRIADMQSAGQH